MERMNRDTRNALIAVVVLFTAIAMVCAWGCRPVVQTVERTVHDTTKVVETVTQRDTVVVVPADAAGTSLAVDVASMQELMRQLQHEQHVLRGQRNASLVLTNQNGRLGIEARCDSVEHRLENAITTIQQVTTRLVEKDQVITKLTSERDELRLGDARFRMPGWLKGTNWLIALLTFAFLVFKLLNKFL
jgi:hypothetical protein